MAKQTREQIFQSIRDALGEESEAAVTIIENISDSFPTSTDGVDWEKRYRENDQAWRKRYTDRFMGVKPENEDDYRPEPEQKPKKSFADLFK